MKYILFFLSFMVILSGCNELTQAIPWPDFPEPDTTSITPPPPVPCTTYQHISDPKFIQGFIEIDEPISNYWVLMVGQQRDTFFPGDEGSIPGVLAGFLSNYFSGQYPVRAWANGNATRISTIVKGTDQHTPMQLAVQFRVDGWKIFMSFSNRGLMHDGAIQDIDTLLAISDSFPSLRLFNLKDLNLDSIEERRYMIKNLHHEICKAGEYWADFRFNNYAVDDSMKNAYKVAGWDNVLASFTGSTVRSSRGTDIGRFKNEVVVDCRGYHPTDDDIRQLLNLGFVVIADV